MFELSQINVLVIGYSVIGIYLEFGACLSAMPFEALTGPSGPKGARGRMGI